MSYQPTEWTTGDVVTPQKLNNIEDGIQAVEASVGEVQADLQEAETSLQALIDSKKETLIINVNQSDSTETLDKTAREIIAAFPNCILNFNDNYYELLMGWYLLDTTYNFTVNMTRTYSCTSLDDYPSYHSTPAT